MAQREETSKDPSVDKHALCGQESLREESNNESIYAQRN